MKTKIILFCYIFMYHLWKVGCCFEMPWLFMKLLLHGCWKMRKLVCVEIVYSHGIHIGTVHVPLVTAQARSRRYRVLTGWVMVWGWPVHVSGPSCHMWVDDLDVYYVLYHFVILIWFWKEKRETSIKYTLMKLLYIYVIIL